MVSAAPASRTAPRPTPSHPLSLLSPRRRRASLLTDSSPPSASPGALPPPARSLPPARLPPGPGKAQPRLAGGLPNHPGGSFCRQPDARTGPVPPAAEGRDTQGRLPGGFGYAVDAITGRPGFLPIACTVTM